MSLALIDADYIPFIASYDKKYKRKKTKEECLEAADDLVQGILRSTKCDSYILALTVGKCFRYKIYPEYKANRKYKQKLKYFKEVKQHLIDKWGAVYNTDLEADDIVCICAKHYEDSFIVSPDKDLLMLQGESYNPRLKEWHSVSKLQAEYSFACSLIEGDAADNVRGIFGCGPAYSKATLVFGDPNLLSTVLTSYIDNIQPVDKAIDDFYLNFKVLRICDEWKDFTIPEPIIIGKTEDEFEESVVKEE